MVVKALEIFYIKEIIGDIFDIYSIFVVIIKNVKINYVGKYLMWILF